MAEVPEHTKQIGNRIRALRELRKVTREELAHRLGMGVSGYGRIERGEVQVSIESLLKISELLNTPVEFLLKSDEKFVCYNFGQDTTVGDKGFSTNTVTVGIERIEKLYQDQIDLLKAQVDVQREEITGLRAILKSHELTH